MPADNADRRESIWSVTEGWQRLYLTLFLILHFAGSAVVVWHEVFGLGAGGGVIQSLVDIGAGLAAMSVAAAGTSLGITEVLVLSTIVERKLSERLRERKERIRREAITERDALWQAWYERLQAALDSGEAFTEPPPSQEAARSGA